MITIIMDIILPVSLHYHDMNVKYNNNHNAVMTKAGIRTKRMKGHSDKEEKRFILVMRTDFNNNENIQSLFTLRELKHYDSWTKKKNC